MKLSDLKENDHQLDEVLPVVGALAGGAARVAATGVGAAARGAMAVGRGVGSALGRAGTAVAKTAPVQAMGQVSGLAGGEMDPAQAAQAAKDRQEQKKQIQDQIKQTEQQLTDLRKQMAELG
jgi:hypothetical protein